MARRSASAAPWKFPENASSCLNAVWITPSDAAAPLPSASRSSRVPRCAAAPRCERGGGLVGAGEADDLVTGLEELAGEGRPDVAGRAGEEDTHGDQYSHMCQ